MCGSNSDSSLPRIGLMSVGGRQAALMLAHFDGKQSRVSAASQSHYLCLQITGGEAAPDGSGFVCGTDPLSMLPLFLNVGNKEPTK